jgi:hypothetical protein
LRGSRWAFPSAAPAAHGAPSCRGDCLRDNCARVPNSLSL